MKILQASSDLSRIEANAVLGEFLVALKMEEELTTVDVIHNKVELVSGLEGEVEPDEEGEAKFHQDRLLALRVLNLVALHDGLLVEDLHSKDLSHLLVPDEEDLRES